MPAFEECFIGEGNYDPLTVLRALQRVGFDGFLLDDHVPHMVDDTDYMHRGRAHAIGYVQALLQAVGVGAGAAGRPSCPCGRRPP